MLDGYLFATTAVTLWVIVDPPGLLPVFLGLTRGMGKAEQRAAATKASLVAFGVIAVFAFCGKWVLEYLHVSVAALQVAGGLLLLLVALELLMGWSRSQDQAEHGINVAVVPLGTPLMAGPGAIVAAMVAVNDATCVSDYLAVGLALVAVMAVVWLFLWFAGAIKRVLRDSGVTLASRIAGLLLAAIAVQMVADGVFAFAAA
ncbi:MAG: MarC family protein [Propionibacteriaceae bacterium]|jgi:multiple antibiotic resistance protein|nr:MarC family protein [Propionibacteriaceae bacterium]